MKFFFLAYLSACFIGFSGLLMCLLVKYSGQREKEKRFFKFNMHADSFLFSLTKLLYVLLSFVFPILNSYCAFILKPSIDRKIGIFQFLVVYVLLHFTLSFSRKNYVYFFQTSGFIRFKESNAFFRHTV